MNASTLTAKWSLLAAAAALAAGLGGCASHEDLHTPSDWTLDNAASDLRFVTTKNTNVAEVQQFKRLSGELAPGGTVSLTIDLSSVATQIPLRDDRMRTLLFEVAQYPTARFEGKVDMAKVEALDVGGSLDIDVAGKLEIHGKSQDTQAPLRVVRLQGDRLMVGTRAPVLVNAAKYDLAPGLEKLREIMGLPNIIGTVPVNFTLVFHKRAQAVSPQP